MTGLAADTVKWCCAAGYEHDAVALLLGESYHPGGLRLTRRLARALALRPGERVLDVASGPGATALVLATEFAVSVDGVDLGPTTVARANEAAAERSLAHRVRFHVGDAERLPFPDATFDAVICECALCTFPDKPTAAAEMVRVLKPGGRVGITDVTVDRSRLPDELRALAGWVACLADARTADEYVRLLEDARLRVTRTEAHDDAVLDMIEEIDARLAVYRMLDVPEFADVDVDLARRRASLAARAVRDGIAGYALLVAMAPE